MADTAYDEKRLRDEAAGWYAKLNNTTISTETLRAFREWRNADDRRAEAYREIEEFWRRSARLQNDPEIQRAVGQALAQEKRGSGPLPRIGPRGVAGAVVLLALGLGALAAWPSVMGRTYRTEVGQQTALRLEDGTRVRLDTDSAVRVRHATGRRDIELVSGRAFFDVAHDPARPFVVRAGAASVTALGTRFAVQRVSHGAEVTLVEGRVRVTAAAQRQPGGWTLAPGEQIETGQREPKVRRIDAGAATSWTTGRLTFRQQSLASAAAEVNRYSELKVVLDGADLAGRQVSGVFDVGDTEAFAKSVAELYQLQLVREGRTLRLSPAT